MSADELDRKALDSAVRSVKPNAYGARPIPKIVHAVQAAGFRRTAPVEVVTTVEQLDAAFVSADDAGEPLTLRDSRGRDWITFGDENGYRWAWSVPQEGDIGPMPYRIDGYRGFEKHLPARLFRPDREEKP